MGDPEPPSPAGPAVASLLTFGEELRQEREIRRISLKEIADATKISKRFLEAIERNNYAILPAPVFTRGFVREYARYLGLNADDMVSRYMHFVRSAPDEDQVLPLVSHGKPKAIPHSYASVDRNVVIFVVLLVVFGGFAWMIVGQMKKRENSQPAEISTTDIAGPASPQAPVTTTTATGAPPAETDAFTARVRIVEDSWIVLEVDGEPVINDELKQGEDKTFRAKRSIRFRSIGNAAGIKLSINGVDLPSLGDNGEVIKNKSYDLAFARSLSETATTP